MLVLVSWLIPYGVLDDVFAENSFLTVKIVFRIQPKPEANDQYTEPRNQTGIF